MSESMTSEKLATAQEMQMVKKKTVPKFKSRQKGIGTSTTIRMLLRERLSQLKVI